MCVSLRFRGGCFCRKCSWQALFADKPCRLWCITAVCFSFFISLICTESGVQVNWHDASESVFMLLKHYKCKGCVWQGFLQADVELLGTHPGLALGWVIHIWNVHLVGAWPWPHNLGVLKESVLILSPSTLGSRDSPTWRVLELGAS